MKTHPEYDSRTLYVPESFKSKVTPVSYIPEIDQKDLLISDLQLVNSHISFGWSTDAHLMSIFSCWLGLDLSRFEA